MKPGNRVKMGGYTGTVQYERGGFVSVKWDSRFGPARTTLEWGAELEVLVA